MDAAEQLRFAGSWVAAEENVDVGAHAGRGFLRPSEQHAEKAFLHVAETPVSEGAEILPPDGWRERGGQFFVEVGVSGEFFEGSDFVGVEGFVGVWV